MKFLLVDSKCKHNVPLALGERGCNLCAWEDLVSKMKPPFAVKCIDDKGTGLKVNHAYTVLAVIIKGSAAGGSEKEIPGFLLKTDNGCGAEAFGINRFALVKQ